LKLKRIPKYARSVRTTIKSKDCFDKFSVIIRPSATEKSMKKMEEENTMVSFLNIRFLSAMINPQKTKSRKHSKDFTIPKLEVLIH